MWDLIEYFFALVVAFFIIAFQIAVFLILGALAIAIAFFIISAVLVLTGS